MLTLPRNLMGPVTSDPGRLAPPSRERSNSSPVVNEYHDEQAQQNSNQNIPKLSPAKSGDPLEEDGHKFGWRRVSRKMHGLLAPHRQRPNRQSLFHLDNLILNGKTEEERRGEQSSVCSVESMTSSSNSSGKRLPRDRNYNISIFQGLKNSGQKPTAEEVKETRRECQLMYGERKGADERRQTIMDTLATLDQLQQFFTEAQSDNDVFFVSEYQAFVCWVYTQIRFGNFASNIAKHFQEAKKRHRVIFNSLRAKRFRVQRLLAVLRFSHICLEYAEVCDDEALQWCKRAYDQGLEAARRAGSSCATSRVDTSENLDVVRRHRFLEQIVDSLGKSITQIELICTHQLSFDKRPRGENLV